MRKVKWISLSTKLSFKEVTDRLFIDSFTEEKGKGFIFDKVRNDYISGRFVEKIVYEDLVPSAYGNESTVERIDYRTTNFSISKRTLPIMQILNPPRTLKPFAQALIRNLGLGVSLEEIDINPLEWLNSLSKNIVFKLTQLDVSRIRISDFAIAKMQITGSDDLRNYYNKELHDKNVHVDRLVCQILSPIFYGKLRLSYNGMAHFEVKSESDLIEIVLENLLEVMKK